MYLKRKIDQFLNDWKASEDRLPIIVKGARQVGKTESILRFARDNYKSVIYINFALERRYMTIVNDGYDVESIIRNITLIDPSKEFIDGDTIIVFDEIQDYPDVATSLKSFKIDGRYDVICSGSLLGINYNLIHSNSVGYKVDYKMYSLDFEEFLWAKGYRDEQIKSIFAHMLEQKPFGETEMDVYRRLFLEYSVLGGMPAVVSRYIETDTFTNSIELQSQICLDYEEDIRKYATGLEQAKIAAVYRSVPVQLAKENKKFQYNVMKKNARGREYFGCIQWLEDAGVISICYCLNNLELPLKGNYDESKFKLYIPDTGLLVSSLDEEAQEDLRSNRNLGVYKGALFENFVAEAFVKQGLPILYYSKENSTLEEDFFVRDANNLIPVEVKSNRKSSRTLRQLINSDKYADISFGIKLADQNIGYQNNIYTFPYFCAFLMKSYLKEREH